MYYLKPYWNLCIIETSSGVYTVRTPNKYIQDKEKVGKGKQGHVSSCVMPVSVQLKAAERSIQGIGELSAGDCGEVLDL